MSREENGKVYSLSDLIREYRNVESKNTGGVEARRFSIPSTFDMDETSRILADEIGIPIELYEDILAICGETGLHFKTIVLRALIRYVDDFRGNY